MRFCFGLEGEGAVDAIGELLVDAGCVEDDSEGREVCIYPITNTLIRVLPYSYIICIPVFYLSEI